MRSILKLLLVTLSLFMTSCFMNYAYAADEARLMREPDIDARGRIVFTYENDLWMLLPGETRARRLTTHPGREHDAKFSPDASTLAFVAEYDGAPAVYVMSVEGSEPKRLTWQVGGVDIVDWSPEGNYLYLIMRKRREAELFRIPASGGAPKRIPVGTVYQAAIHPDGKTLVVNPSRADAMNWRGYRGGRQPDLYLTDTEGSKYERITDWGGYDCEPVFCGDRLFFLSDREFNRKNLYLYDLRSATTKRMTMLEDMDATELSASGGEMVFVADGYIQRYDALLENMQQLRIETDSDHWLMRPYQLDPSSHVNDVVPLGGGGAAAVVEARGELLLLDPSQEGAVNLTTSSKSREIMPVLSPDGTRLAFCSDRSGEYELYVMDLRAGAEWKPVTRDSRTYYYHPVWSPDGSKLVFGDKDYRLYWADLESGRVSEIDRAEYQRDNEIYWEVSEYDWSADSRWVAYAKCEFNLNSSIFLYDTRSGEKKRLTDDRFDDKSPAFAHNGKYLFFISSRNFDPELDPFMDNNLVGKSSVIMVAGLQTGLPLPFVGNRKSAASDEGVSESGGAEGHPYAESNAGEGIDMKGIDRRIVQLPLENGNYYGLQAAGDRIFFLSKARWGFPGDEVFFPKRATPYTLETVTIPTMHRSVVIDGISVSFHISSDGRHAGYLSGRRHGIVPVSEESSPGKGALDWRAARLSIYPADEYTQMFNEVWLQIRNFFYDPDIHGLNLEAVGSKYRALLPFVATRADLAYVFQLFVAEMGTSHMYVFGDGDNRLSADRNPVAALGADLTIDGDYYRFEHIIDTPNWDAASRNPLLAPDMNIREGDYLLAIDGQRVQTREDYGKYLVGKSGRKVVLTVSDRKSGSGARQVRTNALRSERPLRYREWVENNYRKVREASGGRVGYMHLSDMDEDGLRQFEQAFRAERFRDGLIIDVRDNGGGFVSYLMIDKLERQLRFLTKTRDFEPFAYPHAVVRGPMVLLCNEGSGSDGDMIVQQFKDRNMGTVVGTRTWGGLIGIINFMDLIDGSMVTQVNVGFADLNGEWIVENRGVSPDIEVVNLPSRLEQGIDDQLNTSIQVVLEKLERNPAPDLQAPAFAKPRAE